MEGLLTALQILTSLAVIFLCLVTVDSVAKLRRFARKLGKTSTEAVENIAELTRMARERELPHRADDALEEVRRAAGELSSLAGRMRESLDHLDRLLADDAVKSAPGQITDLVARGNDLVTQAQEAVDRLNAVLKAPADAAAVVTQSVLPMVDDAREKVDLLRSLFTALAAGVSAGWDELRGGAQAAGDPGEEA